MALGFHFVPHLFDFSIRADQEATANDSFENPAHKFLRTPGTIRLDHFVSWIAEQRKVQFLLGPETLEQLDGIAAGAQNSHAELVEFRFCVTKLGRLGRSTGSIGFRKEKQQNALALEIPKRYLRACIGTEGEVWGFIANFEHKSSPKSG